MMGAPGELRPTLASRTSTHEPGWGSDARAARSVGAPKVTSSRTYRLLTAFAFPLLGCGYYSVSVARGGTGGRFAATGNPDPTLRRAAAAKLDERLRRSGPRSRFGAA